jgi:hypothetical protein
MSCSIKLKKDKLSKIINKLDFFVFRAMEQKGISFYKISQNAKTAESEEILDKVRRGEYTKEQLQDIIPNYILQYGKHPTSEDLLYYYEFRKNIQIVETI